MQAHIDISSAGIILISVRLCSVNIMGDKIATQPTQTSWCLLYKTEKKHHTYLERHYSTAI